MMGVARQFGDVVRFACEQGYRMFGEAELLCDHAGSWNYAPPSCHREYRAPCPCADLVSRHLVRHSRPPPRPPSARRGPARVPSPDQVNSYNQGDQISLVTASEYSDCVAITGCGWSAARATCPAASWRSAARLTACGHVPRARVTASPAAARARSPAPRCWRPAGCTGRGCPSPAPRASCRSTRPSSAPRTERGPTSQPSVLHCINPFKFYIILYNIHFYICLQ